MPNNHSFAIGSEKLRDTVTNPIPEDLKHEKYCPAWINRPGDECQERCICGLIYRQRIAQLTTDLAEAERLLAQQREIRIAIEEHDNAQNLQLAEAARTIERLSALISAQELSGYKLPLTDNVIHDVTCSTPSSKPECRT